MQICVCFVLFPCSRLLQVQNRSCGVAQSAMPLVSPTSLQKGRYLTSYPDESLSKAHNTVRAAFWRIPAHWTWRCSLIFFIYDKLESGLAKDADQDYWTLLKNFVQLHAWDEGLQAGMPVISRHSAHIGAFAFQIWTAGSNCKPISNPLLILFFGLVPLLCRPSPQDTVNC